VKPQRAVVSRSYQNVTLGHSVHAMGVQSRKSTKNKTYSFSSESSGFSVSGSRVRSHQTLNAKGLNAKVAKQNAVLRWQHEGGLRGHSMVLDFMA